MSDGQTQDLQDLAAAYALGALSEAEMRRFEAGLAESDELRLELAEYREVCALLALDAPSAKPDTNGWERVRAKIARQRERELPPPAVRKVRMPLVYGIGWAAAAAGIVAVAALGVRTSRLSDELQSNTTALGRVRDSLASRVQTLDDILLANEQQFLLTSNTAPEPGIRVYWNRRDNVMVLRAFELFPPGEELVYQFWFLRDDGAVLPSATFSTAADGHGLISVPGPAEPDRLVGAAVSVEPPAGSPQPTTTPVLLGQIAMN